MLAPRSARISTYKINMLCCWLFLIKKSFARDVGPLVRCWWHVQLLCIWIGEHEWNFVACFRTFRCGQQNIHKSRTKIVQTRAEHSWISFFFSPAFLSIKTDESVVDANGAIEKAAPSMSIERVRTKRSLSELQNAVCQLKPNAYVQLDICLLCVASALTFVISVVFSDSSRNYAFFFKSTSRVMQWRYCSTKIQHSRT